MAIQIALIGLLTGTLIGTVGVGGILLAPLLIFFTGAEIHVAQATSSFSFLFTGLAGAAFYARRGSIAWGQVLWLSLGIVPGALLGARANSALPGTALTLILAALIVFAGANALLGDRTSAITRKALSRVALVSIGAGVGFGSALTGTGGPVLLVPVLLFLGYLPLAAVGISQAIQLPVAVFATLGFALYGQIDYPLGLALGLVQAAGVGVGGTLAHRLPQAQLRRVVAVALIGVGLLLIGRVLV